MQLLFDENLSVHVAAGLRVAGLDVSHSSSVPDLGRGAHDPAIVTWCGRTDAVWVTTDLDARSREVRRALVPAQRARAILIRPQPRGALEQLELVVRHYREWQRILTADPRPAVWEQRHRGTLRRLTST